MTSIIESILQDIGNELLDFLGDNIVDAITYSEAEDGVCSVSVTYREPNSGKLIYKFASDKLIDLFFELWEEWPVEQEKWRAAEYVLHKGKFDLNLIYANDFDEDVLSSDRRSLSIKKYFGDDDVDYSRPE